MSAIERVAIPNSEGTRIAFDGGALKLAGTIAVKDPREPLGTFFRQVHEAVLVERPAVFVVDVSELTFVNSSAIRLFVDWATWIKNEGQPYCLTFRSHRSVAWQRTAFMALQSLAKNVLQVEYVS